MSEEPTAAATASAPPRKRLTRLALEKAGARHTRLALLGLVLAGHLAALYWPRVPVGVAAAGSDKLAHVVLFGLPVVVASRALGSVRWPVLLLAVHAPTSELVQHYVLPDRSGDPLDVLADLFGVAAGAAVAWWWASPPSRRGWPSAG